MDSNIPIDIHYNKLLDWLISRRHCKQQWQGSALVIREKINTAIQDMPPVDEITQLLQGTYINYFHCLRIVELLKETESGSKNIFGRYSSQRMKDWLEIVKLYEQEGIYLAEVAQLLIRNVNYEIPALKRQITKCKQAQADCTRKESEYASTASELREKFSKSCRQMGIEGKKIRSELVSQVKDMPAVYNKIGHDMSSIEKATEYYAQFVSYTLSNAEFGEQCVKMLRYMQKKGNTTVYEFRTGETPTVVEEPRLDFSLHEEEEDVKQEEEQTDEINWGDVGTETIDYGISSVDTVPADTIDFGDMDSGDGIDWGTEGAEIDIQVVDESVTTPQGDQDGVAQGSDALTILDTTELRNTVLNELMELEGFLGQRVLDMKGDNVLLDSQFESAATTLQIQRAEVETMLSAVQGILGQLTSPRMVDLILIRSSPRYVDRHCEKLKKLLSDAEKMMARSRLMVTHRQEALDEQLATEPKLELIRQRTQEQKKQIEEEISKKYQNRHVNIMGEINTV